MRTSLSGCEAAAAAWLNRADAEIAAQIDDARVDELKAQARAALDELRQVNADLSADADGVEVIEPPDLPEPGHGTR